MDQSKITEIKRGIESAFIEETYNSNLAYSPMFVRNDFRNGIKVLSQIEKELRACDEFSISVAFINKGGFIVLSETLKELEIRGIRGRILTTDYLCFSDPAALDSLANLKNIELRMYHADEKVGFHTKGYLFKEDGIYRIIVGSSNMTQSALTTNMEWNTQLVSTDKGSMAKSIVHEFEELWNSDNVKSYAEFIEPYREVYRRKAEINRLIKEQHKIALEEDVVELETYNLKPNKMQEEFIGNIRCLREEGATKSLLISATGTGKTYASAFAMKSELPKRALFIVHRELIAKQALDSYKRVFGKTKKLSLLSGHSKEYEGDIIFATMNMMAKCETLERFKRDEFQWICIDEAHRAGSVSYKNILEYFTPDFWLGMTASPERTDGIDVFDLFDHNIAYEIGLKEALSEGMLCPFHYFGISDIEINGKVASENTSFENLTSDERVKHIIEKAKYYGHSGDRLRGIVFCRNAQEARALSSKFNEKGFYTRSLLGEDSDKKREESIKLLSKNISYKENEEHLKNIDAGINRNFNDFPYLDYIFTRDIFNEGVDLPEINQVIMLRPTESPIVFVQQLGRGLRRADDKDYVVIIDFIGNYDNNYMIPLALSGDKSYNKDTMRRYVSEGTRIIPGCSTIHFDEIAKSRIFTSIDSAKTNDVKLIKESFENLKFRLGRIPTVLDFKKYGSIDVNKIFEKFGSYYAFLVKYYPNEYSY